MQKTNNRSAKRQYLISRAGRLTSLFFVSHVLAATSFAQTSVEADEVASLEEIIVTARKTSENVQDIPMSVQVLSAEFLDDADLTRLFELQFDVPGLVVNNFGGNGAGFSLRGVAGGVAPHLNGIYLDFSNLAISRLFDLERIEVLKGPQGTLYGRNSTGGSLNIVTRTPQDEFTSGIEAAYGSFETTRVQGYVNTPFESGAFRLAFIGSEGDGFIRNTLDARKFAEDDFIGLRGSLRVDLTEKLRLTAMLQRVSEDGAAGELWLPNPQFLPDPNDIRLTRVTLADPFLKTDNDIASLDIEYDLEIATLHSLTGYARSNVANRDDCAGMPFLRDCVREIGPDSVTEWSQEFRLGASGDTALDWLVGLYFFDSDAARYYYLITPFFDPAPQSDRYSTLEQRAYALFGQTTLHLSPRWSMTAGLRFSVEDSRVTTIGTGIDDSPTLTVAQNEWDDESWRLDLEYAASDDVLVYAGISTGFKSGGITTNRLPNGQLDTVDPENLIAYETGIKSQWRDRRVTLNGAMFYYDFDDMQVSTYVFIDGKPFNTLQNAAKAEVYGIDASGTVAASDRLTLSGGLVWLPKREFVDYQDEVNGDTLSGNDIIRAPEWTATATIDYRQPLSSLGTLSAQVEYVYRSDFYYTKENTALNSQDAFGLLNVLARFEANSEKWYLFAAARNLTDEDYFTQVFLQSSPGYPDTYEVGFGLRF